MLTMLKTIPSQNRGRFAGIPTRRGYRSGVSVNFRISWYPNLPAKRKVLDRPKPRVDSPVTSHRRTASSCGGSDTTRKPPISSMGAAHSAVTAGGPKDRAVTTSTRTSELRDRAISSALPRTTSICSCRPQRVTSSRRKFVLLSLASKSTTAVPSHTPASTRPGTPPPLPKSTSEVGGRPKTDSIAARNPSACSI
jgi:hypothetical protein